MIVAALPLATIASLWFSVQGTLLVSEATHGSAHNELEQGGVAYDMDEAPVAALTLSEGKTAFTLGYAPQLTLRDMFRPELRAVTFLHNGYASFGMGGPDYRLTLSEAGSFGTQSFTTLRTTPVDPNAPINPTMARLDLLPSVETVPTASLSSAATFEYDWTRAVRSGVAAGYAISGGRGAAAQMLLAKQESFTAGLSTEVQVTHFDRLGVLFTAVDAVTSGMGRHEYLLGTGIGTWSHLFYTGFTFQLTGGVSGTRSIEPGFTTRYSLLFTGAASTSVELVRQRDLVIVASGGVNLSPVINNLNGVLQRRVQGTGSVVTRVDDFSLTLNGDAAQTLPLSDHTATRIFSVGAGLGYAPGKYFAVTAEYRTARQSSRDPAFNLDRVWVALVGVTLRAPPMKF